MHAPPPPAPSNHLATTLHCHSPHTGCASVATTGACNDITPSTPSPAPPTPGPTQSPTASSELTVECGVVLEPSISDWAMGQCGTRTTGGWVKI